MNLKEERAQWSIFIERLRKVEAHFDDCEDALILGNLNEAQDLLSADSIEISKMREWAAYRSGWLLGFIEDLADDLKTTTRERDALMEAENRRLGEIRNLEGEIALLQGRIALLQGRLAEALGGY